MQIARQFFILSLAIMFAPFAYAGNLAYECSAPLLEVKFPVVNGNYSGTVTGGNLFLSSDIPNPPTVIWRSANIDKLYTLMMIDLDGNANGSYPDAVAPGKNAPVRHWIVGNIPGAVLRSKGYDETSSKAGNCKVDIVMPYRAPFIPMVSDRYGIYLFEQNKAISYAPLHPAITNFNYANYIEKYKLGKAKASNYFVAVHVSVSPFSGKPFHGNDVSKNWHKDFGKGKLAPCN